MSLATTELAVPESRQPVQAGSPIAHVASILRRRGLDPANAGSFEDRPDSTDAHQREVFKQAWVNSLRLSGHGDYTRYTVDSLDKEQFPDAIRLFVEGLVDARKLNREQLALPEEQRQTFRPNVQHLVAFGSVGSGKTVAAAAAGNLAVEMGVMARFVSHSAFLHWLRPNSAPAGLTPTQIVERYERPELLILDDLCNEMDEYATNHVRTLTSNLITARANSGRATFFTTNLDSEQVALVLGDRLASRIGKQAQILEMVGNDRRKPATWGIRRAI
jgi:hypothetical protein